MHTLSTLTVKIWHQELLRDAAESRLAATLTRRTTSSPRRFLELFGLRPALAAR